jgi:plasmid maintenance system antidote protein VapI
MKNSEPFLPGNTCATMTELALSRTDVGAQGVPANRTTGILNDIRAITDTALQLARYWHPSEFWLNMQQSYIAPNNRAFVNASSDRFASARLNPSLVQLIKQRKL